MKTKAEHGKKVSSLSDDQLEKVAGGAIWKLNCEICSVQVYGSELGKKIHEVGTYEKNGCTLRRVQCTRCFLKKKKRTKI